KLFLNSHIEGKMWRPIPGVTREKSSTVLRSGRCSPPFGVHTTGAMMSSLKMAIPSGITNKENELDKMN
ncbi:hypothetical protein L9F63_005101, partial [Diploptera punctata]